MYNTICILYIYAYYVVEHTHQSNQKQNQSASMVSLDPVALPTDSAYLRYHSSALSFSHSEVIAAFSALRPQLALGPDDNALVLSLSVSVFLCFFLFIYHYSLIPHYYLTGSLGSLARISPVRSIRSPLDRSQPRAPPSLVRTSYSSPLTRVDPPRLQSEPSSTLSLRGPTSHHSAQHPSQVSRWQSHNQP